MRIEWTPLAKNLRRAIVSYIGRRDSAAARELNESITKAVQRVSQFPFSGKTGRVVDTRECVFHKHYFLVYRVRQDCIEVVAVLHTSQMWPPAC